MEIPYIDIAGKRITPATPKMKVWRSALKFNNDAEERSHKKLDQFIDDYIDAIIVVFGRPGEVNRESLDEALDYADVIPLWNRLFDWVTKLTFSKLVKIPNEETAEAPLQS